MMPEATHMEPTNDNSLFLTKLLRRISHELRTPMNGVMGFAQLIASSCPTDKFQQYGEFVAKASSELDERLRRLLYLHSLIMPQQQNNLIFLKEITNQLENNLVQMDTTVTLRATLPEQLGNQQVSVNCLSMLKELVENAVIHGNPDTIYVNIQSVNEQLRIIVEDDGKGVDVDLPNIKEPHLFDFLSQITKDEEVGFGLGLYCVYFLCKKHHGTMDLCGTTGKGFKVKLNLTN